MRALIFLMLFVGMAMVMHSVYDEKLRRARNSVRVEYRFVPRTLYDEQLADAVTDEHGRGDMQRKFKGVF